MEAVRRIVDKVVTALGFVAGVLMVGLTIVVTAGVVSRYFFELPLQSTAELSGLIFAWLVFLAAIAVTHGQDNIAVTYFRGKLPTTVQWIIDVVIKLLMLAFAGLMMVSSIQLSLAVAAQNLPSLQVSSVWLNGSVAVAFAGITIVLALQIVDSLILRRYQTPAEREGAGSGKAIE